MDHLELEFQVGDEVIVSVREEHDREEYGAVIAEIKGSPDFRMVKVIMPGVDGWWQWVPYSRLKRANVGDRPIEPDVLAN
jgi:hypothetical protein